MRRASFATAALPLLLLAGCVAAPSGPLTPTVDSAAVIDGYLTATGYVTGVSEDGGTCKFTFWSVSGGGASRLTSTGSADGSRTSCGTVSEQATMLLPGDYEVDLTYESDAGTATGERLPVTVG